MLAHLLIHHLLPSLAITTDYVRYGRADQFLAPQDWCIQSKSIGYHQNLTTAKAARQEKQQEDPVGRHKMST
jgi:hypothetical protein